MRNLFRAVRLDIWRVVVGTTCLKGKRRFPPVDTPTFGNIMNGRHRGSGFWAKTILGTLSCSRSPSTPRVLLWYSGRPPTQTPLSPPPPEKNTKLVSPYNNFLNWRLCQKTNFKEPLDWVRTLWIPQFNKRTKKKIKVHKSPGSPVNISGRESQFHHKWLFPFY